LPRKPLPLVRALTNCRPTVDTTPHPTNRHHHGRRPTFQ
jgi:hypothetical protein